MTRIGIFGGTFDPVHTGHLLLAECCREQLRLDAVWFVPTSAPPHKRPAVAAAADRIAMLELALAGNEAFAVRKDEIERGGTSYTVETLTRFREERPTDEFFWLVGGDMLNDFPNWREPARILELASLGIVRRPGAETLNFEALRPFASNAKIEELRGNTVEMPAMGVSSSDLRLRFAEGRSVRYQLPRAVEEYARRLYSRDESVGP